jgi:hypothetical protein
MKALHHVFLLLFCCLALAAFRVADWAAFQVDDRVTVQLPAQPTEMDLSKMLSPEQVKNNHIYQVKDDYGVYQVIKSATGLSAESIDQAATRTGYYNGVVEGLLAREQGTLLTRLAFPTGGGEGLEIKYKSLHKGTGKQTAKYLRSLLVGGTGYSFNFIPADQQDTTGSSGNAQRRRFFDSVIVTKAVGK